MKIRLFRLQQVLSCAISYLGYPVSVLDSYDDTFGSLSAIIAQKVGKYWPYRSIIFDDDEVTFFYNLSGFVQLSMGVSYSKELDEAVRLRDTKSTYQIVLQFAKFLIDNCDVIG